MLLNCIIQTKVYEKETEVNREKTEFSVSEKSLQV